jgi:hypothetical protein
MARATCNHIRRAADLAFHALRLATPELKPRTGLIHVIDTETGKRHPALYVAQGELAFTLQPPIEHLDRHGNLVRPSLHAWAVSLAVRMATLLDEAHPS